MATQKLKQVGAKARGAAGDGSRAKPAVKKKRPAAKTPVSRKVSKVTKPKAGAAGWTPTYNGIGDAAVLKATGKGWNDWLSILDEAGAASLSHAEIASLLNDTLGVGPWWGQMVTVGYEQARGIRQKHERPDGFQISASKTLNVPVGEAFETCEREALRLKWLPEEKFVIRKANPPKTLRATWIDGKTNVELAFTVKGAGKCQVVVQHSRIANAAAATKLKAMWAARLVSLKSMLEG